LHAETAILLFSTGEVILEHAAWHSLEAAGSPYVGQVQLTSYDAALDVY